MVRMCLPVTCMDQLVKSIQCSAGNSHLATDISLGTANGVAAVQYIGWQLSKLPAIRPLTLAIKALLRVGPADLASAFLLVPVF